MLGLASRAWNGKNGYLVGLDKLDVGMEQLMSGPGDVFLGGGGSVNDEAALWGRVHQEWAAGPLLADGAVNQGACLC